MKIGQALQWQSVEAFIHLAYRCTGGLEQAEKGGTSPSVCLVASAVVGAAADVLGAGGAAAAGWAAAGWAVACA